MEKKEKKGKRKRGKWTKGEERRNDRLIVFPPFKIFINSRVNDAGFIIILIESCYSRTRLT